MSWGRDAVEERDRWLLSKPWKNELARWTSRARESEGRGGGWGGSSEAEHQIHLEVREQIRLETQWEAG